MHWGCRMEPRCWQNGPNPMLEASPRGGSNYLMLRGELLSSPGDAGLVVGLMSSF